MTLSETPKQDQEDIYFEFDDYDGVEWGEGPDLCDPCRHMACEFWMGDGLCKMGGPA